MNCLVDRLELDIAREVLVAALVCGMHCRDYSQDKRGVGWDGTGETTVHAC
jgi:hypothetical protein